MIANFSPSHAHISPLRFEEAAATKSPLWGRVNLDKVILLVNTTVILALIGFFYFMKFPFHAIALCAWGVTYVLLSNLAERTRPVSGEVKRLTEEIDHVRTALQKKTSEHVLAEKKLNDLGEEMQGLIEKNEKAEKSLAKTAKKLEKYRGLLKTEQNRNSLHS